LAKSNQKRHSAEAFGKGFRRMHLTELSEKAFCFALGIQCRFGLEVFGLLLRKLITSCGDG